MFLLNVVHLHLNIRKINYKTLVSTYTSYYLFKRHIFVKKNEFSEHL